MSQCMDKYKESFVLEFAKVMQKNGQRWSTSQKNSIRNLYTKWVLAYIGGFIAGFIPLKREWLNYDLNFHIILAIICSLFSGSRYCNGPVPVPLHEIHMPEPLQAIHIFVASRS